jgi:hypothetical protein
MYVRVRGSNNPEAKSNTPPQSTLFRHITALGRSWHGIFASSSQHALTFAPTAVAFASRRGGLNVVLGPDFSPQLRSFSCHGTMYHLVCT